MVLQRELIGFVVSIHHEGKIKISGIVWRRGQFEVKASERALCVNPQIGKEPTPLTQRALRECFKSIYHN
jgi:hypothetical protein